MGNIFCTREGIGSSSLERAAEPKRAIVIVNNSDPDHINEASPQPNLRTKRGKQVVLLTQIQPEPFSEMSSDQQWRQNRITTTFCKSVTGSATALMLSAREQK